MSPSECAKLLRQHQEWRRFDGDIPDTPPMLSPKVIGEAIDAAIRIVDQFVELNELVKQRDECACGVDQCEDILNMLSQALPYVENATNDPAYKEAKVTALAKRIESTLRKNP